MRNPFRNGPWARLAPWRQRLRSRFGELTDRYLAQPMARHLEAVIAVAVFALVAAASTLPAWQALERRVFDILTVQTAANTLNQPIVVVAINEEAMNAMKMRLPWPRKVYAELIDRMAQGGAAVIALDILFAEPSTPEDDAALAKSINKAGNVVLSSIFAYDETAYARIWKRIDPLPDLIDAGAMAGLARISFDPDQFVRQIPDEPDAFWRQIIKILQVRAPAVAVPSLPESGAMIRYLGPDANVFDPIPVHLVLQAKPEELKNAFSGRIVVVGRDLQATAELGTMSDLFSTPFLPYQGGQTSGVKIHATILDNALSGTWLRPLGPARNLGITAFATLIAFFAMRRFRPVLGGLALVAIVLVFGALGWYAFARERTWMALAAPVTAAALVYLAYMLRAYLMESKRKREIQRAFSLYVAPDVVSQIADDPTRLRLGGQRREITVMFTDLAGFTTLTEKTAPDVVQQVLAKHFSMLTDIVFQTQGTVVQFAGDGLMAFWGAPLDDPDHALHAAQAAIEAQKGMERLRQELREQGLPEIKMRVGVNTCEALVGNFGSETRLAYTAMGDGVNLASRLEGANKLYGTPILLSGETVMKLKGKLLVRRVDRIKVAGKSLPVDVFTPTEDVERAQRTAEAFDAYASRDLEMAATLYSELRDSEPDDKVAQRLLERIEKLRKDPSIAAADGSVALEKM